MNKMQKIEIGQRGVISIGLLVAMGIVFIVLLLFSMRGWGYMGYNGWNSGPSGMYWGGARNVYYGRSHREGSISGSGTRGGGFGSGK